MKRATSFPVFLLSLFLSLTLSGASWGRWYTAGTGRFLSEDEIGASQKRLREARELNGFSYAEGNPTKWVDATGQAGGLLITGPIATPQTIKNDAAVGGCTVGIVESVIGDTPLGSQGSNFDAHRVSCMEAGANTQALIGVAEISSGPWVGGSGTFIGPEGLLVSVPLGAAMSATGPILVVNGLRTRELAKRLDDILLNERLRSKSTKVARPSGGSPADQSPTPSEDRERTDTAAGGQGNNQIRLTRPVGKMRSEGIKDAHHVIQDAAVRELPGYKTNEAPGVQLEGPSTEPGSPHYNATQAQRTSEGGTYAAERKIAIQALREAGKSEVDIARIMKETDAYFRRLGVTESTPTRMPGNRRQ